MRIAGVTAVCLASAEERPGHLMLAPVVAQVLLGRHGVQVPDDAFRRDRDL